MSDKQTVYAAPSLSTVVAYLCAVVTVFFVTLFCCLYQGYRKTKHTLTEAKTDLKTMDARLKRLESGNATLAHAQPAAAASPKPASPSQPGGASADRRPDNPQSRETPPARPATRRHPQPSTENTRSQEPEPTETFRPGTIATLRGPEEPDKPETPETPAAKPAPTQEKTARAQADPAPRGPEVARADTDPAQPSATPTEPQSEEQPGQPAAPEPRQLRGKILATNPDQHRVILSLGSTSGIENGARFNVYRGDRWVGDIRVARVFADMSMCEVKGTPHGIHVEDIARAATP